MIDTGVLERSHMTVGDLYLDMVDATVRQAYHAMGSIPSSHVAAQAATLLTATIVHLRVAAARFTCGDEEWRERLERLASELALEAAVMGQRADL